MTPLFRMLYHTTSGTLSILLVRKQEPAGLPVLGLTPDDNAHHDSSARRRETYLGKGPR